MKIVRNLPQNRHAVLRLAALRATVKSLSINKPKVRIGSPYNG